MKISVFLDGYLPYHEFKDPGQIPLGFMEVGIESDLITLCKQGLADYNPKFPVVQNVLDEFKSEKFWLKNDSDVIIAYTWFSHSYTKLIEKMKAAGKKVLIKSDSDGLIGYPLPNRNLRVPLLESGTIALNLALNASWHVPFKFYHSIRAAQIIRQVELSDGVMIESPEALANIDYFLSVWGRRDLIKKTLFVPNPVTPEFIYSEIGKKENIVVSYGRWGDFRQKNTRLMVETIVEFLKERPDYGALIFGSGTGEVIGLMKDVPKKIKGRITVLDFVERAKIKGLLSNAKIFFISSRWEGLPTAACEALCMGCSVAGTPLEGLRYLSMQGFSGTTSSTFKREALLAALLKDAIKWEKSYYEPEKISEFWRFNLNRKNVAKNIVRLASQI